MGALLKLTWACRAPVPGRARPWSPAGWRGCCQPCPGALLRAAPRTAPTPCVFCVERVAYTVKERKRLLTLTHAWGLPLGGDAPSLSSAPGSSVRFCSEMYSLHRVPVCLFTSPRRGTRTGGESTMIEPYRAVATSVRSGRGRAVKTSHSAVSAGPQALPKVPRRADPPVVSTPPYVHVTNACRRHVYLRASVSALLGVTSGVGT